MSGDAFSRFPAFCRVLTIQSKEQGAVPLILNGAQREFLKQLREAYATGIRHFVTLKSRQLGITTVCLAIDLYWGGLFPGIQGSLIADTDDNRDMFRLTIKQYHDGLPREYKFPVKKNNRNVLSFGNGSLLQYLVAGVRKNPNLGQGRAINFAHRTEVSSYGDPAALDRSEAAYADKHPHRLYIDESTAKGYNHWFERWETAKGSAAQKAIFLGWWLKEDNAVHGDSEDQLARAIFQVYKGLDLDTEERKMVEQVKALHGHVITEPQLVWWRFKRNEQYKGDLVLFRQEHPETEEVAFQMTGSDFFSSERLTLVRKSIEHEPPPKFFKYEFGPTVTDIQLHEAGPQWSGARWAAPQGTHLKVWKEPVPGGWYCIGADPAYGSSEWADRFCLQVIRCWEDKVEQVAELCTPHLTPDRFCWTMVHLAAYYTSPLVILELNGPGTAVFQEWKHILSHRDILNGYVRADGKPIANVVGLVKNFMYSRADSLTGSLVYQWKSTVQEKNTMMSNFQSAFENGSLIFHSAELLNEMRAVRRSGDDIGADVHDAVGAKGRAHDDRALAFGLAYIGYRSMRGQLRARKILYQPSDQEWASLQKQAEAKGQVLAPATQFEVNNFLRKQLTR